MNDIQMSEAVEKLAPTLLALPQADRLAIADMLLGSLPPAPGIMSEDDPGLDAELDRRLSEYESGMSKAIPMEEFFQKLREKRA